MTSLFDFHIQDFSKEKTHPLVTSFWDFPILAFSHDITSVQSPHQARSRRTNSDGINSKIKFFMLMMMMESDSAAAPASKALNGSMLNFTASPKLKQVRWYNVIWLLISGKHLMTNVIKKLLIFAVRLAAYSTFPLNLKTLSLSAGLRESRVNSPHEIWQEMESMAIRTLE